MRAHEREDDSKRFDSLFPKFARDARIDEDELLEMRRRESQLARQRRQWVKISQQLETNITTVLACAQDACATSNC